MPFKGSWARGCWWQREYGLALNDKGAFAGVA